MTNISQYPILELITLVAAGVTAGMFFQAYRSSKVDEERDKEEGNTRSFVMVSHWLSWRDKHNMTDQIVIVLGSIWVLEFRWHHMPSPPYVWVYYGRNLMVLYFALRGLQKALRDKHQRMDIMREVEREKRLAEQGGRRESDKPKGGC